MVCGCQTCSTVSKCCASCWPRACFQRPCSNNSRREARTVGALMDRCTLLRPLDPTLVAAAEKAGRKMEYQVKRLAGKAARAELRKNEQLSREAAELMNGLFPANGLQERTLPGIFLLSKSVSTFWRS